MAADLSLQMMPSNVISVTQETTASFSSATDSKTKIAFGDASSKTSFRGVMLSMKSGFETEVKQAYRLEHQLDPLANPSARGLGLANSTKHRTR